MLQRFHDAVVRNRKRTEAKLECVLRKAMLYYDVDHEGDWSMDKLVKRIMEITDGEK